MLVATSLSGCSNLAENCLRLTSLETCLGLWITKEKVRLSIESEIGNPYSQHPQYSKEFIDSAIEACPAQTFASPDGNLTLTQQKAVYDTCIELYIKSMR